MDDACDTSAVAISSTERNERGFPTVVRGMRTKRALPFIVAIIVAACGETAPTPVPESSAPATPSPITAAPSPLSECPPRPFDDTVVLGPEFETDVFMSDQSEAITRDFLTGLAAYYADPTGTDPCTLFTGSGLTTARLFDPRLRAVEAGEVLIDGDLILRVAFEGSRYDLRDRPPVVPIDAIYDLDAGAAITDVAAGQTLATTDPERIGLHFDFLFDGHVWRADQVRLLGPDYAYWAIEPAQVAPGGPCVGFERDEPGAPFDDLAATPFTDEPGRPWCDADGRGRLLQQEVQLALLTRFPCDRGHAAILTIGRPLGRRFDPLIRWDYVRDPEGEFLANGWLAAPYDGDATLPTDATYTGWTNGNIDLWVSEAELDEAIYVVRGATVEGGPEPTSSGA